MAIERSDDRRDSPRVPWRLQVRAEAGGGPFEPREGTLALAGASFEGSHPPVGGLVRLRFDLPGVAGPLEAVGEVIRSSGEGARARAHVRFTEIGPEAALALARHLQRIEEEG